MATFMIGLKLEGDSSEEVIERLRELDLRDGEGVIQVSAQPEIVQVPPELRAPMPGPPTPER